MAVAWTDEQQKVINVRDCNTLVSAAAGSGKTAVLVARILAMITDDHHPVDIDRLLVVTFTNAAAAEMRERIRDSLEQRAEAEPENMHLQRQLVLIHNARITTIHSFCLHVLRNHFQTIGLDPSFRVADTGEVLLLEQDAVKETVDRAYETAGEEYYEFLEVFTTGKSDQSVEQAILQLYHFALGQPWPSAWLEECRRMYEEKKPMEKQPWISRAEDDTKRLLSDMKDQILEALKISEEPDGPYPYRKALESDLEMIKALQGNEDFRSFAEAFQNMGSFSRLGTKKDESISEAKKRLVQSIRNEVKDGLTALRQRYYYDSISSMEEEFEKSGVTVRVLTSLTRSFMERLAEKKAEKNILDFGDLEHLALRILVEERDGKNVPTAAALEYAETFREIMIDEYQDSNLVQELILQSVSGRGKGEANLFMVGDVKQSIYRFRLARPELFLEKYKTYRQAESIAGEGSLPCCRIDLHRNFRSRPQVLESVNYIFRQIMTENPGGIVYDKDAALYPGAVFSEGNDPGFTSTEVLLLETAGTEKQREEARLVGQRIREVVGREKVWDKELESYRPARYGDIVILQRAVSGWAETFGEVLSDMGIPCFTGSQKGYFSTVEVRTVLSYLRILDNPIQDIPLAAVLRSPIGKITDEELAKIRIFSKQRSYYDCCLEYRREGPDEVLKKKLDEFFGTYERLRKKCGHTPVHLLLWELLEVTGYGEYAAALPAGRQRTANLDMLVEKAIAYEATSYRGLYHFVRYIDNLKKGEVDYGEANIGTEAENTVRIMSIHKSKGLEFPIVFVSGMGKQFNEMDIRSRIVMDPDMGIACDCVDAGQRTRRATLPKKIIQQKLGTENLGEELRVLYVAMTRAKEKLILTGTVTDIQGKMEQWHRAASCQGETLSYSCLSSPSSCLDWIMPALLRHPAAASALFESGLELPETTVRESGEFFIRLVKDSEIEEERILDASSEHILLDALLDPDMDACKDEKTRAYLEKVFSSGYPYGEDADIPGKVSVSELKKLSHIPEEEDYEEIYREETVIPLIPGFREEKALIAGAARGTVYHRFMENLDFSKKDELEIQLEELISCGKMSREEGAAVDLEDIRRFLRSESGKRMEQAALKGQLYRERPFVLGVPADSIRSGWSSRETVLIQGIIDACFIEDGRMVVLDYKTDRVSEPRELADKYGAQLDYYALALERLTGYPVGDKIIWSFCLGRDIIL